VSEAYDGPEFVGMDLHRRRSVLVRMSADGRRLSTAKIANSAAELRREIARAGPAPRWCWKPPTAGTGPLTCSKMRAPRCIWRIRWA
jgi:hypothetical protein